MSFGYGINLWFVRFRCVVELRVDVFGERVSSPLIAVPQRRRCSQITHLDERRFQRFVAEFLPCAFDLQHSGLAVRPNRTAS